MGFQPETAGSTCIWSDEFSSSVASAVLEDDVLKQVVFLDPDAEESEEEKEDETEEPVDSEKEEEESSTPASTKKPSATQKPSVTTSQKNALEQAKSYLRFSAFSREGLIGQLEFEEYSHEDAVYAVDHCGADWNEQALQKAKDYLEYSAFPIRDCRSSWSLRSLPVTRQSMAWITAAPTGRNRLLKKQSNIYP